MLNKLIFTILTAALLTFADATTSMADLGYGCGIGYGICDGSGDGEGKGYGHGYGNGNGVMDGSCIADDADSNNAANVLTTEEMDSLLFMREEEKLARDSYLALGTLWEMAIFDNIAVSEQKHMDAVKTLIDCYKLTDPVLDEPGAFSNPELQNLFYLLMDQGAQSSMDGLYVGAFIEETEIMNLQSAIAVTGQTDIVSTYESLMCGSRNHLRVFIRQIEINGGAYTPVVLGEEEFWAIAYSDMERNCGKNKQG